MADKNKVYNFNTMRPVIIIAHNNGNTKAINKDMVDGAEIDNRYFIQWQSDVNKLRETVLDYVTKKKNARFDSSITEGDVYAARERIFPKWKEVLRVGEADKTSKELHVQESDIEDLIGFAWDFMKTTRGTVETGVSQQIFRKKVEALLGCAIAKNMMLNDHDRDVLDAYYKASKRVQQCIDQIAELEASKKNWEDMSKDEKNAKETQFLEFIGRKIKEIDEQIKALNESKTKAEASEKEYSTEAKAIESRIKTIK